MIPVRTSNGQLCQALQQCVSNLSSYCSVLPNFGNKFLRSLRLRNAEQFLAGRVYANALAVARFSTLSTTMAAPQTCTATARRSERHAFRPKRVLMLTKLTRYEFEKKKHQNLTEEELKHELLSRGSNYTNLVALHRFHKAQADKVMDILRARGIDVCMVDRFGYVEDAINWADLIVTAGGDGTFLVGASGIRSCDKPVIGINTDRTRSEGHLLLPCDLSEIEAVFEKMANGEFAWKYRQRIRITVRGPSCDESPVELHDQQLMFPDSREMDLNQTDVRARGRTDPTDDAAWPPSDIDSAAHAKDSLPFMKYADFSPNTDAVTDSSTVVASNQAFDADMIHNPNHSFRILPDKALNEVFIGESHSSRVSYYEIMIDDQKPMKQKSSGLLVSAGTGSTSWIYNVNKLTPQCAKEFLQIVSQKSGIALPSEPDFIGKCIEAFNDRLLLDPSDPRLVYTIRDPVFNNTYLYQNPRGYANKITVRSRCFAGVLVIDGSHCYRFNDGAYATFSIEPEDALKTVELL